MNATIVTSEINGVITTLRAASEFTVVVGVAAGVLPAVLVAVLVVVGVAVTVVVVVAGGVQTADAHCLQFCGVIEQDWPCGQTGHCGITAGHIAQPV